MPDLIDPDGLEADAVVPQCLDNQYISNDIFADMVARGVDYENRAVAEARERNFKTEFIRSLVYSSQVVIQRAFLRNSDFLYKNYQPGNGRDLRSFAELLRTGAIVPFLYNESSFTDNLSFDVRSEGGAATRALLAEAGDDEVRCVRLAVGDADNARLAKLLADGFGAGLDRVRRMDTEQRRAMASELFADSGVLAGEDAWGEFNAALRRFSRYVNDKTDELQAEDKKISRTHVYQDCFAAGGTDRERSRNVALGRFRAPGGDDSFLLETKKFVDLVYNANLPDHLKRYTFTPTGLPSRLALQDAPGAGLAHERISASVSDPEALEWIRRSFMDRAQSAMDLPLLSDLSVTDVLEIRKLPEWEAFKDAQTAILRDPLKILRRLPVFEEAFDRFQRALSGWYYGKYAQARTIGRYQNYVTFSLNIAGRIIIAGAHLPPALDVLAGTALPRLIDAIPATVKGYAAKLMVGVYDVERRRLDANRSYTVELMQTNEELMRDDVIDLIRAVTAASGDPALPEARVVMADQGIK
jgi:hypothetical protein